MPFVIGGAVVAVIVLVLVLNRSSDPANAGQTPAQPKAATPAVAAKPTADPIRLGAAKAGKAPSTPAPTLTTATLQELSELVRQITDLRNESVQKRTNGDNMGARAKMSEAKKFCEQLVAKVSAQLQWQEQAQMEDWAQPAEYVELERIYGKFQKLENEVRRGGG